MSLPASSFSLVLFSLLIMFQVQYGSFKEVNLAEDAFKALERYIETRNWHQQFGRRYHTPYADEKMLETLIKVHSLGSKGYKDDDFKQRRWLESQKRSLQALAKNADFPRKPTIHHSPEYVTNYSHPFNENS